MLAPFCPLCFPAGGYGTLYVFFRIKISLSTKNANHIDFLAYSFATLYPCYKTVCLQFKKSNDNLSCKNKNCYQTLETHVGTKSVLQSHLLSFDDNKVLKLSIGYAK